MSGIAGIAMRQGLVPNAVALRAMAAALTPAGPDISDIHLADNVGLACAGAAPLTSGPCTMAADSYDPGTPLTAYRAGAGAAFAERLRGGHALALHDRAGRRLLLARDPFGLRPLYLADIAGGIAFASEPRALVAAGLVAPRPRRAAQGELLQMQFTTGAETIIDGVARLLPGETVAIADGAVVERRRRAALPEGGPAPLTEADAIARLDHALEEGLEAGAPAARHGVALSRGAGAGVLLAVLARRGAPGLTLLGAHAGGPGAGQEAAEAAARAAGARYQAIQVTEAMAWRELPAIVARMDDPAADHAILAGWFTARLAREEVDVLLCAEGTEELFAGYGRYRTAMRPWWLGGRRPRAVGAFDHVPYVLREAPLGWRDGVAAAEAAAATPGRTRLQAAQAADIAEFLPNDRLLKLHRCMAAHGVEAGTPMLDAGLAALAFRLPDAMKVRGRRGEWILRAWLERQGLAALPAPPRPAGAAPVAAWVSGAGDRLGPLVAAQAGVAEVARPDRVLALFRNAGGDKHRSAAAWNLLFYALWHRIHVERIPPGGDTFATLGDHPARS
jgi:asparagine synthase (glutamine-hydrolysing)